MTSVRTAAGPRPAHPAAAHPAALDLIAAEWIKLRSLRSTYLVLLAAAVIALGVGVLVCNNDAVGWPGMLPAARAAFDPMADSFVGFSIAQLIFAAIGVLTVTGEYSSGLIRTTFAAVPARRAVLAAKATVVCLVTVSVGLVTALATFWAGQAILSGQHIGISLGHPGAVRAVISAALFLVAAALMGLGLGVLIRNAAGALSVVVALLFLAPSFLHGTSEWVIDIANVLPANAIRRLVSLHPWPHAPSITESTIVIVVYPVVALAAAAYVLHRRDA
ncbi:MAG: ABC transporter permease [Actinomycetota bacterium]|nr:ABC transporter permease [Actinomycetota bacterium]